MVTLAVNSATGGLFKLAETHCNAWKAFILPAPSRPIYPGLAPSILSAEEYIQLINAVFGMVGFKDFINPKRPETIGEAIEVPLI